MFADRKTAGAALAAALRGRKLVDPVVLALPRGGVPVAAAVARALKAPLDLIFVRKIGVPHHEELAAAAVVDGGKPEIVVNEDVAAAAGLGKAAIGKLAKRELAEIERRRRVYLGNRVPVALEGRTLIIVDDGIATGASIRVAIKALRRKHPERLIIAVPVAPPGTVRELEAEADEVICLLEPDPFYAIGVHYRDFHQMEDDEVLEALESVHEAQPALASP